MANRLLFNSQPLPKADTFNAAGGLAYALSDKAALAQMAVTGVFNDTYYASGADQLSKMKALAQRVDAEFLAKLAVYARTSAYMKDMPAFLLALVASRSPQLLAKVFDRVCDNGRMLRNFVQIVRSGEAGRRSLGYRPKKLVQNWLNSASDARLLSASIGTSPSLGDVIRLAHPKAADAEREALYAWLMGRPVDVAKLPARVAAMEAFRKGDSLELPQVPFELLTSMPLSKADWSRIAERATWNQLRMNLNTFQRHGVFEDAEMVQAVARRLADPEAMREAKVFPYQLFSAALFAAEDVPELIKDALHEALDRGLSMAPMPEQRVAVLVDTSGSMSQSVTGSTSANPSKMRCVDVAALVASAYLRNKGDTVVVPFDTRTHEIALNPDASVFDNARKLNRSGGGTNCSIALAKLNKDRADAELVIYVSDNESWVGSNRYGSTAVMDEWVKYKRRVGQAKLVCIDVVPNTTTQARSEKDVLNVGGFSDEVFNVVARFARGDLREGDWVGEIEKIEL
jgi:60 kDa SS-A/Ro ribonucleoprotein